MYLRFLLFICAVAVLSMPSFAHAFVVSPTTVDLSASRGGTVEQTITVINNAAAEQTFYLGTLPFVPSETSGAPQFLSNDDDRSGLSAWIHFPVNEIAIPPNTRVDVPYSVVIPVDISSGTYYTAITVSTTPSEVVATNGASIQAKTAMLVFFTVEGETVERAAIVDFVSPNSGLVVVHDLSYAFRVQNQGNVALVPNAQIVVTDWLGQTTFIKEANVEHGRVLPGRTRTFSGELMEHPNNFLEVARAQWSAFAIGPMTATLIIDGADIEDGPAIHYWMFPWQLLLSIVGFIVLTWLIWRKAVTYRSELGGISTGS